MFHVKQKSALRLALWPARGPRRELWQKRPDRSGGPHLPARVFRVSRCSPDGARSSRDSAVRLVIGPTIGFAVLPSRMRHQERQGRRRDAVDPAGLAYGPRLMGLQLMADFIRKPRKRRIIEVIG